MSSPNTIQWSYDVMYKWYQKHQDKYISDDLVGIIYNSQKVSSKLNLEPFIKPNISYIGKPPDIQDSTKYSEGVYMVMDDNLSKREWMFIVTPLIKDNILFADHFTFCNDTTDKKNGVHFHSTTYLFTVKDDKKYYKYDHMKDYFPVNIPDMPMNGIENVPIIIKDYHKRDKPMLLNVIRKPWKRVSTPTGGANKSHMVYAARPIISERFSDLWIQLQYKQMVAFGMRGLNNDITWSVTLIHGRIRNGQLYTAYHFKTTNLDETQFQNTLAELIYNAEF